MKKEIEIFDVNDKLPDNYEHVIMIGDEVAKSGQFINGLFETDDNELYGVIGDDDKIDGADTFVVKRWFPASSLYS